MNEIVMEIMLIVLVVLALGLSLIIFNMYSQIRSIRKQVHFIAHNDTNKRVTFFGKSRGIKKLALDINEVIDNYREREKEMKKQDEEMKDTLTNMSHDIRTPLTSLKGYFELMEESSDPEEQKRYRGKNTERIDALGEILEMMFFYTKVSNMDYKVEIEKIDVSDIFLNTLLSYYDDFENAGLSPEVDIQPNLSALGNSQSLRRIVQNLIKNCLVHGGGDVRAKLEPVTEDGKAYVELSISNRIREDDVPDPDKVFDRFYKADTSRHIPSSGIGLSVVKKLVDSMNGSVRAELVEGIFCITIRLCAL